MEAARSANIHGFIAALPFGYHTRSINYKTFKGMVASDIWWFEKGHNLLNHTNSVID